MKKFYRYNLTYDTYDYPLDIVLSEYFVHKETLKWYWIKQQYWRDKECKRVPKKDNFNKQFAWDTESKALDHLERRLKKRIKWYKFFKQQCEQWLEIIWYKRENLS